MTHLILMRRDYTHIYVLFQKTAQLLNTNKGAVGEPGDGTCCMALEKSCRGTLLQKHQLCNKSYCWSVFKFSKPLFL